MKTFNCTLKISPKTFVNAEGKEITYNNFYLSIDGTPVSFNLNKFSFKEQKATLYLLERLAVETEPKKEE